MARSIAAARSFRSALWLCAMRRTHEHEPGLARAARALDPCLPSRADIVSAKTGLVMDLDVHNNKLNALPVVGDVIQESEMMSAFAAHFFSSAKALRAQQAEMSRPTVRNTGGSLTDKGLIPRYAIIHVSYYI